MDMDRTVLNTAMALALSAASVGADASALTNLVISSGQFELGNFTPAPVPFSYVSGANLIGSYQPPTWDVNVAQNSANPQAVMAWDWGGSGTWVNAFTAACDPQAVDNCISNPHASPSGTIDSNNTIVVDMGSLYINWDGTDVNQGGIATGVAVFSNATTFTYSMSWTSCMTNGPFGGNCGTVTTSGLSQAASVDGQIGTWTVSGTGTLAAVPVPAAAWLLGSGLLGLIGLARRKAT